jgi:hypothetical protein
VKSKKPNIQPIKEFELALRDWSKDLLALWWCLFSTQS